MRFPLINRQTTVQPLWLRITHWVNVIAVVLMIMSGWRIYNASTLFDFQFAQHLTLGGWLGGALQWHFFAMWLLVGNGLVYLIFNITSKRLFYKFFPLSPRMIARDLVKAARGKLVHDDLSQYNALQRAAYLLVLFDLLLLVLSGLVLWKSVQFGLLRELLGGYEAARYIHFFAMAFLVTFIIGHIAMALLVPRTILGMVIGRYAIRTKAEK